MDAVEGTGSKRPANGAGGADQPDPKRQKAAGAKPALNLEALQKAKAVLERQKQLKEKLKKLPLAGAAAAAGTSAAAAAAAAANPLAPGGAINPADVAAKAAAAAAVASQFGAPGVRPTLGAPGVRPVLVAPVAAAGAGPRPLLLDASGREVDEAGNVIEAPRAPVTTSLINMPRPEPPRSPTPPRDEDFFDPSVAAGGARGRGRRGGAFVAVRGRGRGARAAAAGGAFEFVEEGSLARQAEIARLKAKYGEEDFRRHLPPHLRRPPRGPAGPAEAPPPADGAAATAAVGGGDGQLTGANLVPLGVREVEESEEDKLRARLPELAAPPPEVEWWDKPLLEGGAYFAAAAAAGGGAQEQQAADEQQEQQHEQQEQQQQPEHDQPPSGADAPAQQQQQQQKGVEVLCEAPDGSGRSMRLRLARVGRYVEHPVPLEPPDEGPPPPPQPLKLTKRELKKLRTQRRQAREKEKQELIRQGLLEPPKPKVKISNLMRVLGEEATLDPTAIEQEVRRQMSERQAAHDDRNLARSLTPAERREKKLRRLFEGCGADAARAGVTSTLAAVYRVERLSSGQHRFKVEVNAKENQMTGVMLACPAAFSLVLVEGVPKALRRYHKLMLRRIDWGAAPPPREGDAEAGEGGGSEGEGDADAPPNSCHLVWEGVVARNAFPDFLREEVATPEAARKLLADRGVAHYWDTAAAFDFDAAPLPSAVWDRQ